MSGRDEHRLSEIRALRAAGASYAEIGDQFEISGERVRQLLLPKPEWCGRTCERCGARLQKQRKQAICSACANRDRLAKPEVQERLALKAAGLVRCPDCKGTRPRDSHSYCPDCRYKRDYYKGWLRLHPEASF